MRSSVIMGRVVVVCALLVLPAVARAEPMSAGGGFKKFTRGLVNTATGWVEVPMRIHETSQDAGPAAGFTWGLMRGLGHGFIRTAAGLYEVITCPFPAPPNYEPVIKPEYVFTSP